MYYIFIYIIVCASAHLLTVFGSPYENHYGTEYGDSWVLMMDEDENIHYVNFTDLPKDTTRLVYGDLHYYLYTRQNPHTPEELQLSEDTSSFTSSHFNASKKTKMLAHGWLSSGKSPSVMDITNAYMKFLDCNVIIVDWSELADNLIYPLAALSTRYVGKRVAKFLDTLARNVPSENIHLLGHSLGAHVMGYAASYAHRNITRVTGLDPARPLFEIPDFGPRYSLDASDADFVDIIHTCGGVLGYSTPRGHVDFFPDGGRPSQPGCEGIQAITEACSHKRAYELYAESINPQYGLLAYPCESWDKFKEGECRKAPATMGEWMEADRRGSFYLETNPQ